MASKSYWQSAHVGSDRSKDAIKSWFSPICDGMTPYKAEILCDIETDREKKVRAFMTDPDGKHYAHARRQKVLDFPQVHRDLSGSLREQKWVRTWH